MSEVAERPILKLLAAVAVPLLEENKQTIVDLVTDAWKTHGEPIDIPGLPDAIVDPLIERALAELTPRLIDGIVERLRAFALTEG